jgi:AcrR family transcriptional regulator
MIDQADERRAQIIDAAANAFMSEGFAATSIDDVARLLGCTKGLIYYHFKNKTELFFAVHWHTIETNLGEIKPIAQGSGSPVERMRAMIHSHVRSIIDRLAYQRVALTGLEMQIIGSTTPQERAMLNDLLKMYDEYENLFVQVIKEGIADDSFHQGDARLMAKPLLGAVNWMIMWYRPRPNAGKGSSEKLCNSMSSFLLRGLGVADQ